MVESYLDMIFSWLPFYNIIKFLFIMWLVAPNSKGAKLLFRKIVQPFLHEREDEIDAKISLIYDRAISEIKKVMGKSLEGLKKYAISFMSQNSSQIMEMIISPKKESMVGSVFSKLSNFISLSNGKEKKFKKISNNYNKQPQKDLIEVPHPSHQIQDEYPKKLNIQEKKIRLKEKEEKERYQFIKLKERDGNFLRDISLSQNTSKTKPETTKIRRGGPPTSANIRSKSMFFTNDKINKNQTL